MLHRVVLTRGLENGKWTSRGYVNGAPQFSGEDKFDVGVATQTTGRLLFFQNPLGAAEAEPGFVERIAIFDRALSDTEARALQGTAVAVPEPAAGALFAAGAALLLARRRRLA